MLDKKRQRLRRARRARAKIERLGATRLCVFRSPRHIYAQLIDSNGSRVIASASTVEPTIRSEIGNGGNVGAAAVIGKAIAERAKAQGIESVAFDRSGFRFHGRIKALADAARENGLQF
jgi:large subunit ribosomal protein L18